VSRGTAHLPLRIPADLLARVDACVAELQERTRGSPPTRSDWIRKAIEEALAKRERSRTWRRARKAPAALPAE
jgi:hypothetical protein